MDNFLYSIFYTYFLYFYSEISLLLTRFYTYPHLPSTVCPQKKDRLSTSTNPFEIQTKQRFFLRYPHYPQNLLLLLIIPFKIRNLAPEESAFTRGKKLYKIKIRRKEGEIFRLQMFSLAKKGGVAERNRLCRFAFRSARRRVRIDFPPGAIQGGIRR